MDADDAAQRRLSFDMLAASIRADALDIDAFLEAFALKMSEALPGSVTVERESRLFSAKPRVRMIRIDLDDRRYELIRTKSGLECQTVHRVRDITLKSQPLPLDEWIDALSRQLLEHAERSGRLRKVLEDMVR